MILWVSVKDRIVEMTAEDFGLLMSGRDNPNDGTYQVLYKTDSKGKIIQTTLNHLGEIKPGQEFVLKVKIVDPKNRE